MSTRAAPEALAFVCPLCRETIRIPASYAGKKGRCPRCKGAIQAPRSGSGDHVHFDEDAPVARPIAERSAPAPATPAEKGCPDCGARLSGAARTCGQCGAAFVTRPSASDADAPAPGSGSRGLRSVISAILARCGGKRR